jgi:hypothetical protein
MSLLISENETFDVKVKYVLIPGGITCFEENEEAPPEAMSEWFRFKRPNWEETCEMMSYAMVPHNGTIVLNPYRLVDAKLKVLMTAWSLKDEKGNPLECKPSNVAKLNPAICEYIHKKLDFAAMPSIYNESEPVVSMEATLKDGSKDKAKEPKAKGKKSKAKKEEALKPDEQFDKQKDEPKKSFFDEDKKDEVQAVETPVSPVPELQETQEIPKPSPEASPQ